MKKKKTLYGDRVKPCPECGKRAICWKREEPQKAFYHYKYWCHTSIPKPADPKEKRLTVSCTNCGTSFKSTGMFDTLTEKEAALKVWEFGEKLDLLKIL